ncbi:MAG: DUF1573 domain-containing protein [Draconibacterium sp.]
MKKFNFSVYLCIFFILKLSKADCLDIPEQAHTVINNNATIVFENTVHDFGELELNGNGSCSFVFSNPGNAPLLIQQVKTSCGCTVPEWPARPIKPGSGEIKSVTIPRAREGSIKR